jgi:hypothetical protein
VTPIVLDPLIAELALSNEALEIRGREQVEAGRTATSRSAYRLTNSPGSSLPSPNLAPAARRTSYLASRVALSSESRSLASLTSR